MSQSASDPTACQSVAEATRRFVVGVRPSLCRLEAKVASREGMPLLCAIEAALAEVRPRPAAQELVWLSDAPPPGRHRLRLLAFGPANELLAEAVHDISA